nr:acyltransferase family protein [Rhodoferax koreense]
MPIAYQFWFIRDLMVLVVFSPLIFIFINKIAWVFLTLLLAAWVFDLRVAYFPDFEALLYFSLGCFFSLKKINLFFSDKFAKIQILCYFVILVLTVSLKGVDIYPYFYKFSIIWGCMAIMSGTKYVILVEALKNKIISLGSASFFVYATHEPMLTAFKKVSYGLVHPENQFSILALYFLAPTVTIAFTLILFFTFSRYFPSVLRFVTGGR